MAIIEGVEKGKFGATGDQQTCKWCDYGELCGGRRDINE